MKTGRWLGLLCAVGVGFVAVSCDDEMPTEPEVTTPTITETAPLMQVGIAAEDNCLNDLPDAPDSRFNNATCTANDVKIKVLQVLSVNSIPQLPGVPVECVEGDSLAVELRAFFGLNAKDRFDIGYYFSNDGSNDARTGQCVHGFLDPIENGGTANPVGGPEPYLGAYTDLEPEDGPDICGDAATADEALLFGEIIAAVRDIPEIVTLICTDPDGDGFLEVGTCTSWDNNDKDTCESVDDAVAGTPSKCNCNPALVEVTILATLTLEKTVINLDGGTATQANFQAYIDSVAVPWDTAQTLDPGSYTASEDVFTGYTAGVWGGDCAEDGTVTLAAGDSKTCTITNDDQPAYLTLEKTVINLDGGTATQANFQAYIDSVAVPWDTAQAVGAGTFTASEDVFTGYTAGDWGGDCDAGGSVTLALGEHKTCTITNDDDPAYLTLEKTVINLDGGTAVAADFQAYISGSPVPWDTAQSVGAGSFTASEDLLAGYTASVWGGDCAADGSVALVLGDNKTCTITNDDIFQGCEVGDRVVSVTLEVTALSSSPVALGVYEKRGQDTSPVVVTYLAGSPLAAATVGTEFRVDPFGGAPNFDTQNLRFTLDGAESKQLKVHLSCSDDPYVGQTHSGDGVTLTKTAFVTAPNQ